MVTNTPKLVTPIRDYIIPQNQVIFYTNLSHIQINQIICQCIIYNTYIALI